MPWERISSSCGRAVNKSVFCYEIILWRKKTLLGFGLFIILLQVYTTILAKITRFTEICAMRIYFNVFLFEKYYI